MSKYIDFNKTVAELVKEFPEIKGIMAEIGFKDITNSVVLSIMGKIMTIPKGAAMKNIPMDKIIAAFESHGFEIINNESKITTEVSGESGEEKKNINKYNLDDVSQRQALLEQMITRLNSGENLESVRADFVKHFEHVSVQEIVNAEQKLIQDGVPMEEVQKLCDIHSALFHGKTEAEVWKEEELAKQQELHQLDPGHPIQIMKNENAVLLKKLEAIDLNQSEEILKEQMLELKNIQVHYAKKAELFYPFLEGYGITGPSHVMWGVDDEIKGEISEICVLFGNVAREQIIKRIGDVVVRAKEMIYKEENILFPMAMEHFTEEQWKMIYRDIPEMGYAFICSAPKWQSAEEWIQEQKKHTTKFQEGRVNLPTGQVTVAQLTAIFDLLPIDITFIDENEILRFFTNKQNIFARPLSALGREVYACHPARIVPVVKQMIADFKAKKRDHMEIWMKKPGNPVKVQYLAVYGEDGSYVGTLELVQSFGGILQELKEFNGENPLL